MLIFLHMFVTFRHIPGSTYPFLYLKGGSSVKINAEQGIMDYILQKEYDNMEKVLYQFNMLLDDVKALEREIQVLERHGAPAGYTARSVECARSNYASLNAQTMCSRLEVLLGRHEMLLKAIEEISELISPLKGTPGGRFIYLRYYLDLTANECCSILKISRRQFFRIRLKTLDRLIMALRRTEIGRLLLLCGPEAVAHRYLK